MAERIVQESSLVAVANKIRERTGISDVLEFPGAWIEVLDLIGGLPNGITAMEVIDYTPTRNVGTDSAMTLEHNLGVAPNFVLGLRMDGSKTSDALNWTLVTPAWAENDLSDKLTYHVGSETTCPHSVSGSNVQNETEFFAKPRHAKLLAGVTYRYYVGVIEGISQGGGEIEIL